MDEVRLDGELEAKVDRLVSGYMEYTKLDKLSAVREHASQIVPGLGSVDADVMLVGEAPGRDEDRIGEPFVGAAGKVLDGFLESISLKRELVYITNVIKYRPPDNRDPWPEEIDASLPLLEEEISIVDPKVVVTLGVHSLSAFFGMKLRDVHGVVLKLGDRFLIPLYHPARVLYRPEHKVEMTKEFATISDLLTILKEKE